MRRMRGKAREKTRPEEEDRPLPVWGAPRWRLYSLRGMPCPLCRRAGQRPLCRLVWTGVSLACARGHGWSNPDALCGDLLLELRGPDWAADPEEAGGPEEAP